MRFDFLRLLAIMALLLTMQVTVAEAAGRFALVIGNSAYQHVTALPNPANDARAVAAALERLDFSVSPVFDLDNEGMRQALKTFSRDAADADIALVYFAGHGMEMDKQNYLIPVDATLESDRDVRFEAFPLDSILDSLEGGARLKLVLLDACRNNPFLSNMKKTKATRSLSRGLSAVEPTSGTLVSYSAKEGTTAGDGDGEHSPYTQALLNNIEKPGLELNLLFRVIRDEVLEKTGNTQEPFSYSSLPGQSIYLNTEASPAIAATDPSRSAATDWQIVSSSKNRAVLDAFIKRYADDAMFTALAEERLAMLDPTPALQDPQQNSDLGGVLPLKGAPIKIGLGGPISGPNAVFGEQMKRGVELAAKHINDSGGMNGSRIEIVLGDDASDPKQGVAAAQQFVASDIKFVVGHFNSGVSIPASEIYQEAGILQVSPSSTNPRFTERGLWNVFRVCGRDDQQGGIAATYMKENFGDRRIAIVSDGTAYGGYLAEDVRTTLGTLGAKEAYSATLLPDSSNMDEIIGALKKKRIGLLYFGGLHTEAGNLLKKIGEKQLDIRMMSGDGILSSELATIAGDAIDGTMMTFAADPRRHANATKIVEEFRAGGYEPEGYALYAYAALQTIAQAANRAGTNDPKRVAEAMKTSGPFDTVLGDLAFDEKGDRTTPDYVVYRWRKGADGQYSYFEE